MNKHKFKSVTNRTGTYDFAVYCEYCGLVVFNANSPILHEKAHEEAKLGCPCNVLTEITLGGTNHYEA